MYLLFNTKKPACKDLENWIIPNRNRSFISKKIMDDNLQEFSNPDLYDAENRWSADDEFYLNLALQIGGPILDVACGTGRLTRAIAEKNINVTGIDIMSGMLARARLLSEKLNIEWIQADCREFN